MQHNFRPNIRRIEFLVAVWTPAMSMAMSIRRSAAQLPSRTREFSDEPRAGAEHRIEPALKRP
jgi:hypothetical protein